MHELMDWLINEVNGSKADRYIIRREEVKGKWYLSSINIPVEDDVPIEATWTALAQDALKFHSVDQVHDFAVAHLMPRICTIIKTES